MLRTFALPAMAVAAALLGTQPSVAQSQPEPIKITIGFGGDGLYHFYPLYVAMAEHFFEKEGLKVDWLTLRGGSQLIASLVGGSAQVAPAALEHMVVPGERAAGLVEFAELFAVDPYSIVLSNKAMAKSGIKPDMPLKEKLSRLKGLTIGITAPGGASDTFVRFLMKQNGLNADGLVHLQPMASVPAMLGALQRNMVDGLSMSTPIDTMAVSKGYGQVAISAFNVPSLKGMPFTGMMATRTYIAQHPEVITKVTRAITEAIKFNIDHPEQTRKDLFQYSVVKDPKVYDEMIRQYQKGAARTPVLTEAEFDKVAKWVQMGEKEPIKADFATSVDNSFAKKAAAELLGSE
jgi:NitT/TauT family transport system substrate-binding protein